MEGIVEITTKSNVPLKVTIAPFQDANALKKAILKAAKGLPISRDILSTDMSNFKDFFIEAATSDDVESALYQCLARCTYGGIQIKPILFDDPKLGTSLRADYYEIAWEVVKANVWPFFEQTFSRLKTHIRTPADTLKSA